MKEYEKLAREFEDRDPFVDTLLKDAYIAGFFKAREMILAALPNSPDIDFKKLYAIGEKEC